MTDRKRHISTLWLTYSLALLVLVAPMRMSGVANVTSMRMSGVANVTSRPGFLPRDFAVPTGQPKAHLGAAMSTDAVLRVYAVLSESNEQEEAYAQDEPRVPYATPFTSCNIPDLPLIASRSIPSVYPLRC
jgi:hypothetical protein